MEAGWQVEDPAVVKVHVWRCMKLDLLEPWCDYACPLDESVAPEPVHLAGADGTYLCGTRHRLQVPLAHAPPRTRQQCALVLRSQIQQWL